jgi:hypothetical protein
VIGVVLGGIALLLPQNLELAKGCGIAIIITAGLQVLI